MGRGCDLVQPDPTIVNVPPSGFFQTREFLDWEDNMGDKPILSLIGQPGSGKSVLMKKAVHRSWELEQDIKDRLTLHFFFNGNNHVGHPDRNSSLGMYRTFLHQAVESQELPPEELLEKIQRIIPKDRTPWSLDSLRECFKHALKGCTASVRGVYIFLDALDEWSLDDRDCSGDINFLKDLTCSQLFEGTVFRICFSSRPFPLDKRNTSHADIVIHMEEYNQSDMEAYLEAKMHGILPSANEQERKVELFRELSTKANHNFLWLVLVLRKLRSASSMMEHELKSTIDDLPEELFRLYEPLLSTLDAEEQSRKREAIFLFQLIGFAQELLTLEEVLEAVSIHMRPDELKMDRKTYQYERFAERISDLSRGLIQVKCTEHNTDLLRSSIVQFTHNTVRQFLMATGRKQSGLPFTETACHSQLLDVCLKYFKYDNPMLSSPKLKLQRYVSSFWMHHAGRNDQNDISVRWPTFLVRCNGVTERIFERYYENVDRRIALGTMQDNPTTYNLKEVLVLLSSEGCTSLLIKHRNSCPHCTEDKKPGVLDQALHLAVEYGKEEMVELMVRQLHCKIDGIYDFNTPLFRACYKGMDGMVRLLLSLGANIHRRAELVYSTPLNAAVGRKQKDVINVLLNFEGVDRQRLLKQKDGIGRSPLHIAAGHGSVDVVDMLLDCPQTEEDWEELRALKDVNGKTPEDVARNEEVAVKIKYHLP